jgi:hypothetical protein
MMTHTYRTVTNAPVHACATRVGVILDRWKDELAAIVEDDGRGFEPGETGGGGPGSASTACGSGRPCSAAEWRSSRTRRRP